MKQYIIVSYTSWRTTPSRAQQLSARLRDSQVLFFQPARPGRSHKDPGRQVRPNVTVYSLPPLRPLPEGAELLLRHAWRGQAAFIRRTALRHGFRSPVLWTTHPQQVYLLDHLNPRGLVYDCDADWSDLPPQWEGDLAAAADVVFAASPGLLDRLSPCNANIALVPNGVNYPMFSRPGLEVPAALGDVRGPVLGWVGRIDADLDLSPVEYAALEHPEWTFALVGRVSGDHPRLARLERLDNVRFLGRKPSVEVPDYVSRFDVCLDLRRREQDFSDVLPRRIYEYLSTGKPIVTLLAPDQVEEFPDVIYGAHSPADYCRLCERALAEDPAWVAPRRRDYGAAAAWSRRSQTVQRILGAIGL